MLSTPTERELAAKNFRRDGVVCLRRVFDGEALALALAPPSGGRPDSAADAEASVFTKLPDTLRPEDPFRHPGFHKL